MSNLLSLLMLPPVAKGLIAMTIAGICFPAAGVMVLRLDLVPMRYMLMHGVILGGALSLAFSLPMLPVSLLINLLLVFVILKLTGDSSQGFGISSAAAMVFTMAMASLVMHIFDVPAKDTLQLLWGSPFALGKLEVFTLACMGIILIVYVIFNFKTISAIFFDQEIAQSLGMHVRFHHTIMLVSIAMVIALAMKLLGALLIDALLILPVLIAAIQAKSLKQLFIRSCLIGLFLSFFGFLGAIVSDLPPSGTIALLSALLYLVVHLLHKRKSL
ncbi:metal ABC transporter permease [uncultured Sphaerochaeta sp.]|uniref:metal ABC transporter permease n=1 Tax=uncultured Sphaerochaeta sp. TaxID=886478 RepID=UPI002A0A35B5|nr:metal ABC transporter permease [uncultured Sphaerochaeta sp.]